MRQITEQEAIELSNNNYIKLIYSNVTNQKKLDKLHESMLSSSKFKVELIDASELIESCDTTLLEENIKMDVSTIETMQSFLDGMELTDEISKDKLENCFNELYKQTKLMER